MKTRPEPESSSKSYPTATSLENVLQQPENTITTCASAETQKLVETLTTTTSRRSRPKGQVGGGGGAELKNTWRRREEGSDLDHRRRRRGLRSRSIGGGSGKRDLRSKSSPLPRRRCAVIHGGRRARKRVRR